MGKPFSVSRTLMGILKKNNLFIQSHYYNVSLQLGKQSSLSGQHYKLFSRQMYFLRLSLFNGLILLICPRRLFLLIFVYYVLPTALPAFPWFKNYPMCSSRLFIIDLCSKFHTDSFRHFILKNKKQSRHGLYHRTFKERPL